VDSRQNSNNHSIKPSDCIVNHRILGRYPVRSLIYLWATILIFIGFAQSHAGGLNSNLRQREENDGDITDVTDQASVDMADSMFRDAIYLANKSAKILSCQYRVRYRVTGSRGSGFGSVCLVDLNGREGNLLVCNENMVGAPTIKLGGFAITQKDVANFTRANCEPG